MLTKEFENMKCSVNKNKNRNIRFVNVRAQRNCCKCNKLIDFNEECLSINARFSARRWECLDCVATQIEIFKVGIDLSLLPFDDEGGYIATKECLDELEARFL